MVNVKSGSCILIDRSYCNMRTDDLTVDTTEPTVVQAFYCRVLQKFVMVTAEQNIILLNEDFSLCKQVIPTHKILPCKSSLLMPPQTSPILHCLECESLSSHYDKHLVFFSITYVSRMLLAATAYLENNAAIPHP